MIIGKRCIGKGHPTYVIAEISANHNHEFERAVSIVEAAKASGADAVKIQTYTADTMTIDCENKYFTIQESELWRGETLYGLYQRAYTPWDWQPKLQKIARDLGLDFFSTPYETTSLEFLIGLDIPVIKIASFELTDLNFLSAVGATRKPIILSTGMATLEEINKAVNALRNSGTSELALLKCTSAYPCPYNEMNLRTIPDLEDRFGVTVGLSDHTLELAVPLAAVALGASIVEKHLTLNRKDGGPDSEFSLEPQEFKRMVDSIRILEQSLGSVDYGCSESERKSLMFRRSIFIVEDLEAGNILTSKNLRTIRPGFGLSPEHWDRVMGKKLKVKVDKGTPLTWNLIE